MKIKLDREASQALSQLSDWALKFAGLKAVPLINALNSNVEEIKPDEKKADVE